MLSPWPMPETKLQFWGNSEMTDPMPHKIAIVDDDQAVRESLRFFLELVGHTVEVFACASDFLRSEFREIAWLILDHHMPHMTGLELAERLRGEGVTVPILLITGSPSPTIAARAAQIGIDRVLEKPLSEQDLMDYIKDAQ